jgi:hypothetical protein
MFFLLYYGENNLKALIILSEAPNLFGLMMMTHFTHLKLAMAQTF